jgi:uncharacterized protein DUF6875
VGTRIFRPIVRRVQRLLAAIPRQPAPQSLSEADTALATEVLAWMRRYVAQPHPNLGRSGPVCPFVQSALDEHSVELAFDKADGSSTFQLRAALLRQLAAYKRQIRRNSERSSRAATVLAFPRFKESFYERLDDMHSELKTDAMSHGVMVSAFHPRSTHPAQHNPSFYVLRAPFAAFAFRKMVAHDIIFLNNNRRAFAFYRTRFGHLHEEGLVSDEYGYASAFAEALKRFKMG